jgi:hypothetical protein
LLGGLLLVTLICLVLVVFKQVHLPLTRVLLFISSAFVVVGLLGQARDIGRAVRQQPGLPVAARTGWRLAARWRIAAVVLMVLYWCFDCAVYVSSSIPESDLRFLLGYFGIYRSALLYLLLIIGLTTTPRCVLLEARRTSTVFELLGWAAVLVWFCIAFFMSGLLAALVHMALNGIENAQPYRASVHVIHEVHLLELHEGLVMLSVAAGSALLLVLGATLCLVLGTRPNSRPGDRRWLLGAHAVCLATATLLVIWIRVCGLAQASPYLAAFPFAELSPYLLTLAALLTILVSGCMAQRLSTAPSELKLRWRRMSYPHEGRLICLLCVCSVLAERVWSPHGYMLGSTWFESRVRWLVEFVEEPTSYLGVCLTVVAVIGLIGQRRERGEEALCQTREVRWLPFAGCWFTSALTLLVAAESLLWTSFVFWLW